MTQQEAKMKEFYDGKIGMIRMLRGKESRIACCRVLRGHPLQKMGSNGSIKKCSSPLPLSQAFVEQKRRGGREFRLGMPKHSAGTPRRRAQIRSSFHYAITALPLLALSPPALRSRSSSGFS